MTDISFLTILTLISISVPGIAKIIQSALIGFICMDLLQTDKWLANFSLFNEFYISSSNGEESEFNEETPLNPYFEENGFETMVLVKNLGSTFVYLFLFGSGLLMLPLLKVLSNYS